MTISAARADLERALTARRCIDELAVTRALRDEGARIVAGAHSYESLDGIDGVTPVALDLAAPEGPARLIERAIDEHGPVDVLINHVGADRLRLQGFLGTSDGVSGSSPASVVSQPVASRRPRKSRP